MPELPDVEVYRRYLDATGLHQRIRHTHVEGPALLDGTSPQGLGRALKGASFASTHRHGKYLFALLDRGGCLVLHFGMTGELRYFGHGADAPDYTQCLIEFDNRFDLAYVAPRKLGRIALAESTQSFIRDHELGPDALELTQGDLKKLASGRRGAVKSWLMNQAVMAGIGNVYSDEILFQAGIHPKRPVDELDERTLEDLHGALRSVLQDAIDAGVEPQRMPASFLLPHRAPGGKCPRCGGSVEKVQAAGRRAWYCPQCQPESP